MKEIINAEFIVEIADMMDNMYRLGWHERNSGNVSYLLEENELVDFMKELKHKRTISLKSKEPDLANKYFLVSGTNQYFKNTKKNISKTLGIIKIGNDGSTYDILWGFDGGGRPTSELPTHLSAHATKLKENPNNRMVLHAHATNLLALTFVHELDEKKMSNTLWRMSTESIVVFPKGVGVLPWMVCGNETIALATAQKLKSFDAVIWAFHGVFATGNTIDDTFGLIETLEKSAMIYIKTANIGIKHSITTAQLKDLANAFNVVPRKEFLE